MRFQYNNYCIGNSDLSHWILMCNNNSGSGAPLEKVALHKCLITITITISDYIHSFIHSGHFYSAPSSPLLLRGAPDYSTDTVSEFHAEAHRQLQVKDLPKVPTWRLERESNPRPYG